MKPASVFSNAFIFLLVVQVLFGANLDNNVERTTSKYLIKDPACAKVKEWCGYLGTVDDLNVIECVQATNSEDIRLLKKDCQLVIHNHTERLIDDKNVQRLLSESCSGEIISNECQVTSVSGTYLACVLDLREDIKTDECLRQISRLESVAFFDLRWVAQFLKDCDSDLMRLKCNSQESNKEILFKGELLGCLQKDPLNLESRCRKQVLKLSEIQADNIKLDPEMYTACAADRLRFCRDAQPGTGLVFKCLVQHKSDKLSDKCRQQIVKRQRLIVQDFKINKGLMKACREDIRVSKCRKVSTDDKMLRLGQILKCLERYIRNGSRVSSECEGEMMDQRRALMEDYRLSVDVLEGCRDDIKRLCNSMVSGRTIHCLMNHAGGRSKAKIADTCRRALEDLVKETDAGEDWRADPVLHEACSGVVRRACNRIQGGNARVMSCLMDNLGSDVMTSECENAVVQIQYFIARDFRLDPNLYRACQREATEVCHARQDDWDSDGPDNSPLVLPCLYRYAYHPDKDVRLSMTCFEQVRRVMRQRALRVDLIPEVEDRCIEDLAQFCYDKTKRGEETACLQKHLQELREPCKIAVSNLTEDQSQHAELNPQIAKYCGSTVAKYCNNIDSNDNGELLECLIAHKNEQDIRTNDDGKKCRAAVEHFQLISLKNYRFTYKFKVFCKPTVARFCGSARTKPEVVACLSEILQNDTLSENRNRIPKDCRQQLRAQLLQQRENIDFNSALSEACGADIESKCSDVPHGAGRVLECLRGIAPKQLHPRCKSHLFKIDSQDMQDNGVDYGLVTMCRGAIRQFCDGTDQAHVLDCLEPHVEEPIDPKCRQVLLHRLMERSQDYRFDPRLRKDCKNEIGKFCSHVLARQRPDQALDGIVTECLKGQFRLGKLSAACEARVTEILRMQALDYHLDPLLRRMCSVEIEALCRPNSADTPDDGRTGECLKNAFLERKRMSQECKNEVANLIEESEADIHVDPLLQRACTGDLLQYCGEVKQGGGKLVQCLMVILNSDKPMQPECKDMLAKRVSMFKNAAALVNAPPDDILQLYAHVAASPARRYFAIVGISAVGCIFFAGLFCGRLVRRARISKNK